MYKTVKICVKGSAGSCSPKKALNLKFTPLQPTTHGFEGNGLHNTVTLSCNFGHFYSWASSCLPSGSTDFLFMCPSLCHKVCMTAASVR